MICLSDTLVLKSVFINLIFFTIASTRYRFYLNVASRGASAVNEIKAYTRCH